MISGEIYFPFEIYELSVGVSLLKVCTFLINVAIVGYLSWYLVKQQRLRAAQRLRIG